MNIEFARRQMIEQQVRTWDVFDAAVLAVLGAIPREQFVAAGYESLAFADVQLPIGHGQLMMTPTVEGRLLQALNVQTGDSVLEIGTGSGFITACLARLAKSVTSIDIFQDILDTAAANLADCGISTVELALMDATQQLPDGIFDVIAVTGSLETYDPRYAVALKPGGRLFVIVGAAPLMEARLVRRINNDEWQSECLFETSVPPLINASLPVQFYF